MSITVTTAASATDLTELATVKIELDKSDADDDAVLVRDIAQASDFIRKYTGRKFERETITETLPGTGHVALYLSRTPIVTLTSVTVNNVLSPSDEYTLNDAEIGEIIRHDDADTPSPRAWPVSGRLISGLSQYIQDGSFSNNISVVYVAGYLLPCEDDTTLPFDIERAAIEIVKYYFERRKGDPAVRFEKIGDSAQAMDVSGQLPLSITSVLDRWVRVPVTF